MVGFVVMFRNVDVESRVVKNATAFSKIGDFWVFTKPNPNSEQDPIKVFEVHDSIYGGCYGVGEADYIP